MQEVAGLAADGGGLMIIANIGNPAWQKAATEAEQTRILEQLSADIAAGALGIGLLLGYAPGVDPQEYLAVARLAAAAAVPTFTHCRDLVDSTPRPGSMVQRKSCAPQARRGRTCTTATSTARPLAILTACSD